MEGQSQGEEKMSKIPLPTTVFAMNTPLTAMLRYLWASIASMLLLNIKIYSSAGQIFGDYIPHARHCARHQDHNSEQDRCISSLLELTLLV